MLALANGVYPLKLAHMHVFFIERETDFILVDVGLRFSTKKLRKHITLFQEKTGKPFGAILITHHHIDHVDQLRSFERDFHIPIFASSREIPIILGNERMQHAPGFIANSLGFIITLMRYKPPKHVKPLPNSLKDIQVIPLYGHTIGHVGFYHEPSKTLLPGDAFTFDKNLSTIELPPKYFSYDTRVLKDSLRTLNELVQNEVLHVHNVFPSHGKAFLQNNPTKFKELLQDFMYTF